MTQTVQLTLTLAADGSVSGTWAVPAAAPPDPPPPTPPPLTQRHPDAGAWLMYPGQCPLELPEIRGVMAYAKWKDLEPSRGVFNWSSLDRELNRIAAAGKAIMVDVTAGYAPSLPYPDWIHDTVARRRTPNANGDYPYQFWDARYRALYREFIAALADHLAGWDAAQGPGARVVFVRAAVMAETMENLPNEDGYGQWTADQFTPARDGQLDATGLTKELAFAYQAAVSLAYQDELRRAYTAVRRLPPTAAAKGADYWRPYPTRDALVAAGVWFDHHSGTANPQGVYYDLLETVKTGQTRGASESGGRRPAAFFGQYTYWEVLAMLHAGVEFIGLYGTNAFDPTLQPQGAAGAAYNRAALRFAARYAGHYRQPAAAPGAWVALRGYYPVNRWGDSLYMRHLWTNYEFLMCQLRPQDSQALYGLAYTEKGYDMPNPTVERGVQQPWPDEVAVAAARFGPDLAAYLQQPPPVYVGLNGKLHQYAYAQTDLGVVAWQGETIFAEPGVTPDRTERMLWARQTLPARGGELHFAVHPDFAASLRGKATLRVVYLDRGTDQWSVRYDSPTGVRTAGTVTKTNSNRWREVRWTVPDARLQRADRTQGDVILSDHGDGADIFHLVEVLRA